MLKDNEIQKLYEDMRPAIADTFTYQGDQLRGVVDALERMPLFSGCEIEVLDSPFYDSVYGSVDDGNLCVTVQLNNMFKPRSKVRIYSIAFTPGVFKENMQNMNHGVYLLPPTTSEVNFKLTRTILTKIELDRIADARFDRDSIIEPAGVMVGKWERSDLRVADLKATLMREFEQKLDRILKMDLEQFADTSDSDVHRFGKVYVRVSRDSFDLDSGEDVYWDNNSYFRVIEAEPELPF
jgi:hypothetical protein